MLNQLYPHSPIRSRVHSIPHFGPHGRCTCPVRPGLAGWRCLVSFESFWWIQKFWILGHHMYQVPLHINFFWVCFGVGMGWWLTFFFEGWASNIGCGWFTLLVLPCLVKKWLLSGIPKSQHGILRLKLDIKDYIKWYVPSEWQMNSSIKPNQPTDQRFSQHMVQTWTILKRPIDVNNLGTMPSRLFDGVAGQWQCCLTITRSSKCYWQSIMI